MLLLNAPIRKDFKDELLIVMQELESYDISYKLSYDNIFQANTITINNKDCEVNIFFNDYFIRYKDIKINNEHYVLVNKADDVISFHWRSKISGGACFEYLSDISIDQALFNFLDARGFKLKEKPLTLFDFGLEVI